MSAKSSRSAKSKSRSKSLAAQVRALAQRPGVQYVTVFVAAYAAFLITGLLTSLIPLFQFLPQQPVDSTSSYFIWYNFATEAAQTLIPAILFGAGFWLSGRGLKALGAKRIESVTLWLSALIPALLLMMLVLGTSMLSVLGYMTLTPNAQVIYDLVTIPLLGLFYVAGWRLVRARG